MTVLRHRANPGFVGMLQDQSCHQVGQRCLCLRWQPGPRRHAAGYRPQFSIKVTDVTGTLHLPEGVEMVMPGDNTPISAELMTAVALEKGARFAIREGGRTVGAGTITEIIE